MADQFGKTKLMIFAQFAVIVKLGRAKHAGDADTPRLKSEYVLNVTIQKLIFMLKDVNNVISKVDGNHNRIV